MLLAAGFWRDGIALCTSQTPANHIEYLRRRGVNRIVAGENGIDLAEALLLLRNRFKVRTIRVDSGGTLNAALLQEGLVDELSLLVHPVLAGTAAKPLFAGGQPLERTFRLFRTSRLPGGLAWLRYRASIGKRKT